MWECLIDDPNVQQLIREWKSEEARSLLYKVLASRSFPVTSDVRDRINGEPDLARLEAWLTGAVTAGTIGDVFRDDGIVQSDIQCSQRVSLSGAGRHRLQSDIVSAKYEINLYGVRAQDLPLVLLGELADLVVEGSMRAARLAVEGRSTSRDAADARQDALAV